MGTCIISTFFTFYVKSIPRIAAARRMRALDPMIMELHSRTGSDTIQLLFSTDKEAVLFKRDKNILWLIIDGCHAETFRNLYESGNLPNLRRAMGDALVVDRATSCFPSVTLVCLSSLATGCWFKTHGLLNNVWYDRTWTPFGGRAYLSELDQTLACFDRKQFGFPTLVLPDLHTGGMLNNDIDPDAKTIYEVLSENGLTSYAVYNYVGRGATVWRRPGRGAMLHYAEIDKRSRDYPRWDKFMVEAAMKLVASRGLPHLMSLYFGGHDGQSHHRGVGAQSDYLRKVVDLQMGRLFNQIQKKYELENLYVIISADHGQTGFPRGGAHKFLWKDQIVPMLRSAAPGAVVDGGEQSAIDPAANVAYAIGNGAGLFLYVRNRESNAWPDAPRLDQDLLPVAHAVLRAADPSQAGHPAYIGPFLDFLLLRTAPDQPYMIYENEFPYNKPGRLTSPLEYFAFRRERYPDAPALLQALEHPTRGPDLIAVLDYDKGGWYFSDGPHLGNHGSFTPEDIYVPLFFSGPDVRAGELPAARIIDIAPTIASLFGLDMPSADGQVLDILSH